jgi:Ni,Fe-hydrogenase I large subunit
VEVGPLARVMIAYGNSMIQVVSAVNSFLYSTGLTLPDMYSTIGRTGARAIETKVIADVMSGWVDELNLSGNTRVTFSMLSAGSGFDVTEVPRGALGHWLNYSDTKIVNYQMVVPSTWNFGPRDASGTPGPVEQALAGTPIANTEQPLEVLRVVHSFDPCLACAVHLVDITESEKSYIMVRQSPLTHEMK